jgi:putative transposase
VSPSGFYQWLHEPLSDRASENLRLPALIRVSYAGSGGVYAAPRVFLDLRETGERCGNHRMARIMRINKINALRGYKAPRPIARQPSILYPTNCSARLPSRSPTLAG